MSQEIDVTQISSVTATASELNHTDGVTSAIQTQIDGKQSAATVSTANPSGGSNGDIWLVVT